MKKIVPEKGNVDHYIVRLTLTDGFRTWYRILQKTREGIQSHDVPFYNDDSWQIVGCADRLDLQSVCERLQVARTRPWYDLLLDNCEQFARFVIEGEGYSTQVRTGMLIAGIVLATTFFVTRKK